jgi:methylglutaconyl-CoA hydratase
MEVGFTTLGIDRRRDGVAWLRLLRPDVYNAFDEVMIRELDDALMQLEADSGVRCIVITGDGRHFCAGADLHWMQRASNASEAWNFEDAKRFARMLARIDECSKPTVARVQGVALGGGTGLACACDIVVASEGASFAASEARFGILPAVIGPYLVNAVGNRQARRLALTASRIDAAEALRMGLVHVVAPDLELDTALERVLRDLLAAAPQAQREIKQLFAQLTAGPVTPAVRDLTAATIARVRGTNEAREGFAAFFAKRPPAWGAK